MNLFRNIKCDKTIQKYIKVNKFEAINHRYKILKIKFLINRVKKKII